MTRSTSLKYALLAAASLVATGAVAAPIASIETAPIELAAAGDQDGAEARRADVAVKSWIAGGAVAAALAGLIRLFGWKRVSASLRAVGGAAMAAPAAAVRYVGDVVRSPLRFLAVVGALSLFALIGAGFYDIEWIAGLATGAALALLVVVGLRQVARLFTHR